jgi:hypothetical protein
MEERVRWKIVEYLRFLELQPMIAAIQALTTSVIEGKYTKCLRGCNIESVAQSGNLYISGSLCDRLRDLHSHLLAFPANKTFRGC